MRRNPAFIAMTWKFLYGSAGIFLMIAMYCCWGETLRFIDDLEVLILVCRYIFNNCCVLLLRRNPSFYRWPGSFLLVWDYILKTSTFAYGLILEVLEWSVRVLYWVLRWQPEEEPCVRVEVLGVFIMACTLYHLNDLCCSWIGLCFLIWIVLEFFCIDWVGRILSAYPSSCRCPARGWSLGERGPRLGGTLRLPISCGSSCS